MPGGPWTRPPTARLTIASCGSSRDSHNFLEFTPSHSLLGLLFEYLKNPLRDRFREQVISLLVVMATAVDVNRRLDILEQHRQVVKIDSLVLQRFAFTDQERESNGDC